MRPGRRRVPEGRQRGRGGRAHRSYFANDATNLAVAGLEESLYRFKQMGTGIAPATDHCGFPSQGRAERFPPVRNTA